MQKMLRRIRGALGMGLMWAFAWSAVGSVPRWVFGFKADAPFPIIFGVLGFIAGLTFSVLLVLAEGRRAFDEMKIRRFAAWGALGGFLLSGVFTRAASLEWGDALIIMPTFAIASALCAAGSLALARKARMPELPASVGNPTDAALASRDEQKQLLR